jgi:hypothetical protein
MERRHWGAYSFMEDTKTGMAVKLCVIDLRISNATLCPFYSLPLEGEGRVRVTLVGHYLREAQ